MTDPAGYPRELERDVVLRDGAQVHIRPIRPDDAPRLVAAYERLRMLDLIHRYGNIEQRRRDGAVFELIFTPEPSAHRPPLHFCGPSKPRG